MLGVKQGLLPCLRACLAVLLSGLTGLAAAPAAAQSPAPAQDAAALVSPWRQFALDAARQASTPGRRVQIQVGELDPRLRLAPCAAVQPYLPAGTRLWGATHMGLRCNDGRARWNVFLPITVAVYAQALVANAPLAAGTTLAAGDLRSAEVDLAAAPSAALTDPARAIGRTLARAVAAGAPVRQGDLRARQWFAAGENVRIVAVGSGWRVDSEGQALAPGIEGQAVRVRTVSGRIVSGIAVAERSVEVAL